MAITDDEDLTVGFSGDGNTDLGSEKRLVTEKPLVTDTTVLVSDYTVLPEQENVMNAIVTETKFSAQKPADFETENVVETDPTIDILAGLISYQAIVALLGVS